MINTERIVPVTATDLLTLIGTIMKLAGTSFTVVESKGVGAFAPASGSGNMLASEPLKFFDFGDAISAAVVYFVPAYDYKGFAIDGTAVTTAGTEVAADGCTLYTATLSGGTVTIAKKGL